MFSGMLSQVISPSRKPKVPAAANVDLSKEATRSYEDIASSLPKLQDIASQINAYATQNMLAQARTILPGIGKARKQAMANTSALLRGEIPADVLNNLRRAGASAALRSGTAGSTFGWNLSPESIGTTSLALQQQGLGNLESLATTFKPPTAFDYSTLFVTPQQRAQNAWLNEQARFSTDWMKNKIAAMPTGLEQEFYNFSHQFDQLAWDMAGTAAGGGIGGMLGGGGGAKPESPPAWSANDFKGFEFGSGIQ